MPDGNGHGKSVKVRLDVAVEAVLDASGSNESRIGGRGWVVRGAAWSDLVRNGQAVEERHVRLRSVGTGHGLSVLVLAVNLDKKRGHVG